MFPVDGDEAFRPFTDIKGEEAVLVCVDNLLLGVDGYAVLGALQDRNLDTYIAVGHKVALGVAHHSLIGEHVRCLSLQGEVE